MQHDFILLDRSQSMSEGSKWVEALASINLYVKKLAEEAVDTGVTLATFDKPHGDMAFDVIRDRITPQTWKPVTNEDAQPRGNTPLNDAIGRIVNLANRGVPGVTMGQPSHQHQPYDRVAIIIGTDGEENASRELNTEAAKRLLDQWRAKGWQVIFLGADYDNMVQAASFGAHITQTVSAVRPERMGMFAGMTASKRAAYGTRGVSMDYSEEEKKSLQD